MGETSFTGEVSVSFASTYAQRNTLYFATMHAALKTMFTSFNHIYRIIAQKLNTPQEVQGKSMRKHAGSQKDSENLNIN